MDNNGLAIFNGAEEKSILRIELAQSSFLERFDLTGIEVIDLKVDGNAKITARITENETAKILAIEARSKAEILAAIAAGASGAMSSKILAEDAELAIQALKQGFILVDNRESNICNFLIVPRSSIETKLEQLQGELATALICCWRKKPLPEDFKVEPIIEKLVVSDDLVKTVSLGLEKFSTEKELKLLSEQWNKRRFKPTKTDLDAIAIKYRESYFLQKSDRTSYSPNSTLSTIRLNAYKQKELLANKIADLFLTCNKFGSIAVEQFFKSAMLKLQKYEIYWESQHQAFKDKARQCWLSHDNLTAKVASGKSRDFESAVRALDLFYEATTHSEVCRAISCMLFELIRELNIYRQQANNCDRFLQELESIWGENKQESIEIDKALQTRFFLLRNELESRLGSIFNWSDCSKDRPELADFVTDKVFKECRTWALELILEKY